MDCGRDTNAQDSDIAFRILADGDLVDHCEQVLDL